MAALLRLAGVGAFENGDDDSDDEDGEAPPNALMKLTGKRPAETHVAQTTAADERLVLERGVRPCAVASCLRIWCRCASRGMNVL